MTPAALVVVALGLGACSGAAPAGFSGGRGDQWTFPLVGPLENGVLLTAVTLNTHGPYVFAIDPDAGMSVVDAEVVRDARLRTFKGPPRLDESNTEQRRVYAEVLGMELGSLIVEQRDVMVAVLGAYDTVGRRVSGVIGRDILGGSLVFGFDRDQGLGYLIGQKRWKPPPGASAIPYDVLKSRIPNAQVVPEPRRLAGAKIGGQSFSLHLDLGAVASQLRDGLWERAGLGSRDVELTVVDEVGSVRQVKQASDPVPVVAGGVAGEVAFVPYDDKRWDEGDLAGTLGLGFFTPYAVWLSWDDHAVHVTKRIPATAGARIARWESAVLAKCPHTGCVEARLVDPLQGKPPEEGKPHPGVVLSISRDERAGGMDLEVYFEAEGRPDLPYLILNLPAHVDRVIHQLKPEFLGAKLVVVDASPYPRKCPSPDGCVDRLAR